jgi:hypothetical protein
LEFPLHVFLELDPSLSILPRRRLSNDQTL